MNNIPHTICIIFRTSEFCVTTDSTSITNTNAQKTLVSHREERVFFVELKQFVINC